MSVNLIWSDTPNVAIICVRRDALVETANGLKGSFHHFIGLKRLHASDTLWPTVIFRENMTYHCLLVEQFGPEEAIVLLLCRLDNSWILIVVVDIFVTNIEYTPTTSSGVWSEQNHVTDRDSEMRLDLR